MFVCVCFQNDPLRSNLIGTTQSIEKPMARSGTDIETLMNTNIQTDIDSLTHNVSTPTTSTHLHVLQESCKMKTPRLSSLPSFY